MGAAVTSRMKRFCLALIALCLFFPSSGAFDEDAWWRGSSGPTVPSDGEGVGVPVGPSSYRTRDQRYALGPATVDPVYGPSLAQVREAEARVKRSDRVRRELKDKIVRVTTKMEVAELLIQKGADVNAWDSYQWTPAMTAEANSPPDLAEVIRGHRGAAT
jgi:hypothetical protein